MHLLGPNEFNDFRCYKYRNYESTVSAIYCIHVHMYFTIDWCEVDSQYYHGPQVSTLYESSICTVQTHLILYNYCIFTDILT